MVAQAKIEVENITEEVEEIRLNIYQLLAGLLRDVPSQAWITWIQDLALESHEQDTDMGNAWAMLKLAASKTCTDDLADEYQQVFIGIGRGEVLPYASWYLTGSLMEMPLANLRHDLRALGFERQNHVKEPEDHMAALLEVMAMLIEENAETEQRQFFNRHILPWYQSVFYDIEHAPSAVFYSMVAQLATVFLDYEKDRMTPRATQ